MLKKKFLLAGKAAFLLLGITFLSFLLVYYSPGDPAVIALSKSGMKASEEVVEAKRKEMGLDQPIGVQYARWLGNLLKGDLGESYKSGKPVAVELKKAIFPTLLLTVVSMALTILLSTPLGILCAKYKDGVFDSVMRVITYLFASFPSFFIALMFMYIFSLKLGWFSVIGSVSLRGIVMPALVLSLALASWYIRQVRGIVLKEMEKEYVEGLRSRGISERRILFVHVLKNCLFPLITLFGISFGLMLGGSTLVESIFSWPGVGRLAVASISARDYPVIQAYVVWMAVIFLIINAAVEFICKILDPRVRRGLHS